MASATFTLPEAIDRMKKGEKITHDYFGSEEWMTMLDSDTIIFEDGCRCNIYEFLKDRQGDSWEIGYSIYNN